MTGGLTKGLPIAQIKDPKDPRHGTPAGRVAHHRMGETPCGPCKAASARYGNQRKLGTKPGWVSSVGFVRRCRALQALGWTLDDIAAASGISEDHINGITSGKRGQRFVTEATHRRMVKAFKALSMRIPPDDMRHRVAKSLALRNGYVPPLAWDDIDNDEAPVKSAIPSAPRSAAKARLDILRSADEKGKTAHQVAEDLGVSLEGLNRWCKRHDHMELYWRLLKRDPRFNGNQYAAA